MKTCKIPGGCPCTSTDCPRHGICADCIAHHAKPQVKTLVACMRLKREAAELERELAEQ